VLTQDITLDEAIAPASTIDLNGHTLTLADVAAKENGVQIIPTAEDTCTIKNGKIEQKRNSGTATFYVPADATLVIEDTEITETGSGAVIYPAGDASNVTIKNSKLVGAWYAIATNASKKYTCDIVIENSELSSGYCTVCVNVPVNLTMDGCTVTAPEQGLLIRGASAQISNCKITLNPVSSTDPNVAFLSKAWGSGSSVPSAAITIGNRSTAYQYPTVVKLQNTQVAVNDTYKSDYPALYAYANTGENLGVTLEYDSQSTFTGRTTTKVDTETVYDSKSIILGTTTNITINK